MPCIVRLQSLADTEGIETKSPRYTRTYLVCCKVSPDTEGIETKGALPMAYCESWELQSLARHRGHRNRARRELPVLNETRRCKASPDTEGIETRELLDQHSLQDARCCKASPDARGHRNGYVHTELSATVRWLGSERTRQMVILGDGSWARRFPMRRTTTWLRQPRRSDRRRRLCP